MSSKATTPCWSRSACPKQPSPRRIFRSRADRLSGLHARIVLAGDPQSRSSFDRAPGARNPAFDGYRRALPRRWPSRRGRDRGRPATPRHPARAGTALDDPYFFPAPPTRSVTASPNASRAAATSSSSRERPPARRRVAGDRRRAPSARRHRPSLTAGPGPCRRGHAGSDALRRRRGGRRRGAGFLMALLAPCSSG